MCKTGEVQDGKVMDLDCPNPEVEWWESKNGDLVFGRCAEHKFATRLQSKPASFLYRAFTKLTLEEYTVRMVMER